MKRLPSSYKLVIIVFFACALSFALTISGCKKKTDSKEDSKNEVVAKYKGGEITLGEFEKELMAKHQTAPIDTNDRIIAMVLNSMIEDRLMDVEAHKLGIDSRPEIEDAVREYRKRLVRQEYLNEKLKSAENISRETLNKYYNDHLSDYEEVRFRDILIRVGPSETPESLAELKKKSEEVLAKAKAGEDFAALASQYTDDLRFKNKGGDVGFVSLNSLPSQGPMRKALAGVEPGQVVPEIVADFSGFHVLMLVERRTTTFERVEEAIKAILVQQNKESGMSDLMKKLRTDYGVQVFENNIKKTPPQGLPEGHP